MAKATPAPAPGPSPHTLAFDIGGTGLKAALLDAQGEMVFPRAHIPTPHPCPPETLLAKLAELAHGFPPYDRISAGFPGAVRHGVVLTAPNLGAPEAWHRFPLAEALAARFHRPARVLNDAEVQGLGVIKGQGMEVILTLGTGAGIGIFLDGVVSPHIELSQHPVHKKYTYDTYLGAAALEKVGVKHWNRRLRRAIDVLARVTLFDALYLGGGNAHHVRGELPPQVTCVPNEAGLTGGIALWRDEVWRAAHA
jgi:polyphosphate glucokinase